MQTLQFSTSNKKLCTNVRYTLVAVRCWLIASNQFKYIKIVYATRKKTHEREEEIKNDKVNYNQQTNSRAQDEILCLYCMNCNWFFFTLANIHANYLLIRHRIETKVSMHFSYSTLILIFIILSENNAVQFKIYGNEKRRKKTYE